MSARASQCSDEKINADSGEMCSGVVIFGLVHVLVLTQERQDKMLQ